MLKLVTFSVAIMICAVTFAVPNADAEVEEIEKFDSYYIEGDYSYVGKVVYCEGVTEDGYSFDTLEYVIVKSLDSGDSFIEVNAFNDGVLVFEDQCNIRVDNGTLSLKEESDWVDLNYSGASTYAWPIIGAIASIILTYLTAQEVAAIAAIFVTGVIAITYEDFRDSITEHVNEVEPEAECVSVSLTERITVMEIDGVPTAVHNGDTDEAAYFVDFELSTLQSMDPDEFYLVCKLRDELMIAPVPMGRGHASTIIDLNSPLYHTWTPLLENASRVVGNANLHVLPYYEECGVWFPHWHPAIGNDFLNSMSFCGFEIDDYREDEVE